MRREYDVLREIATDKSNAAIAQKMPFGGVTSRQCSPTVARRDQAATMRPDAAACLSAR